MKNKFTEKQGQYLAYIHHYIKLNGVSPSEADMQRYFKVTAPTVHQMIVNLENKGGILKAPKTARSIKLKVDTDQLPPLK